MMSTGTPDEQAEQAQKARAILEKIAEHLNELEEIAPGSTYARNGVVGSPGVFVRRKHGWGTGWEIVEER